MNDRKSNVVSFDTRRPEPRERALERLFNEHRSALHAFLRMRMGPGEDFEDLIQEVFVRLASMDDLCNRLPSAEKRNRAFIFTVANNLLVDLKRHQAVRDKYREEQAQAQKNHEWTDGSAETEVLAAEKIAQLKGVIMELPEKSRDAFVLTRFMHKSYKQVAQDMGVSVRQVRRYVTRALVEIRKADMEIEGVI